MGAVALVGRGDELSSLVGLLDHGGVAVLSGEAGMGKSRLLDELAATALHRRWQVRRGQADDVERTRPLHLLEQAFTRRALHGAAGGGTQPVPPGGSLDPFDAADRLLDELDDLLTTGPVLVLLDDLQWADRSSLQALRSAVRRLPPDQVGLVLAHRPSDDPDLVTLRAAAADRGAVDVALTPLTASEVDLLVDAVAGACTSGLDTARRAAHLAGGRPFHVIDVVRRSLAAASNGGPPGASSAMDPAHAVVLRSGAVLSRTLDTARLAAVTGQPEAVVRAAIDTALDRGLLQRDDGRVTFRHDLLREALTEGLSDEERRALHLRLATVLEDEGAPSDEVASHLVPGAGSEVVPVLRRAAATAPSATALELLDAALELLDPHDPAYPEVLAHQARVLLSLGRIRPAASVASSLAEVTTDLGRRLALHVTTALGRMAATGDAGSLPSIEHWVGEGRSLDDHLGLAVAEYGISQLLAGHIVEATCTARLAGAAASDDEVVRIITTATLVGTGVGRTVWDELPAQCDSLRSLLDATERTAEVAGYGPWLCLGTALARLGRTEEALAVLADGRRTMRAFGLVWMEPLVDANTATALLDAGRWDDALAVVAGGLDNGDEHENLAHHAWLLAVRALVLLRRGQRDEAVAALDAADGHGAGHARGLEERAWAHATAAHLAGDVAGWADVHQALAERLDASGLHGSGCWWGIDAVRAHLAAGRSVDAHRLAARLPGATDPRTPAAVSARAAAALLAGDGIALLACADAIAGYAPYESARLSEDAAALLDGDERLAAARRALDGYDALGAVADGERLRDRLGAAVPPRRPSPVDGWQALTPTERLVTDLVCAGCSNAEIAAELGISHRTVETHLHRVYNKVGVRSRLRLAAAARDLGDRRAPS